jgi:uncharacterized membrane protein
MTFERTWILLFAWIPLAWAVWSWRASSRRGALVMKAFALSAVLLALAEPRLTVFESKVAVAVLVDTSASVTPKDLDRASDLATRLDRGRGRNFIHVIPFARGSRPLEAAEQEARWRLKPTAGEAGAATDLEAAVREGMSALPAGRIPRLVLISDGQENLGSVVRAAWQARQLGIPIDTFPLAGRATPELRLESVVLPSHVFSGERFPIELTVTSPRRTTATVEITAEKKILGSSTVTLEKGASHIRVNTSLTTAGATELTGTITTPDLGTAQFSRALTLRRPRVLFVSQDPPGTEAHLFQTLEAAQFQMQRSASELPGRLNDFQIVVLNNSNLETIPAAAKSALEEYVKQGGGLLVIGGERNIYAEKKTEEDALERALPAKLAPPRTPEGTCVVLILDKSSSMEGKKMELARQAAIGVVDNLRPIDLVGVLIFDNSFHWSVPIRKAAERTLIKRVIAGITPDGGTQIAPALQEAYRRILPVNAIYKHVVLLTDGISEEGDSLSLSKEAAANRITISTVGLGQDVNRTYLEKVALLALGKSYFLSDPSGLEQILLRDVMEHTGSTAVEKPIRAQVVKPVEILDGVGMDSAPALQGYVRFISKPTAEVILTAEQKDPLYVRWQFGLGRAAVFTSDAKSRWAKRWVAWPGFEKLWPNIFRDLLPHAQAGETTIEYDSASGELVVDYRLGRSVEEPTAIPDIFAFGPDGFQRPVKVAKVASGVFRGRVALDHREGLFRVRPLAESRAFPEAGYYRPHAETEDYGANEDLLRHLAEFTGGRFNPTTRQIFDAGGRTVASTLRLWPGLLALALALNLLELILRKWKGVAEMLRPSRQAAEPAPEPVQTTV